MDEARLGAPRARHAREHGPRQRRAAGPAEEGAGGHGRDALARELAVRGPTERVLGLEGRAHGHGLEEVDGGEGRGRQRQLEDGPAEAQVDEPVPGQRPGRDDALPRRAAGALGRRAHDAPAVADPLAVERRGADEDQHLDARRRAPGQQLLAVERAQQDDRRDRDDLGRPARRVADRVEHAERRQRAREEPAQGRRRLAERRERRRRRAEGAVVAIEERREVLLAAREERGGALRRDHGAAEAELEARLDGPGDALDGDAAEAQRRERDGRDADGDGEARVDRDVGLLV